MAYREKARTTIAVRNSTKYRLDRWLFEYQAIMNRRLSVVEAVDLLLNRALDLEGAPVIDRMELERAEANRTVPRGGSRGGPDYRD